jgi:ribonuclease R
MWKLGVHIADVAEYVKEGSALDKEALRRGTSVYLADRVIPMLPRKLSNGICSLNAGEDRLALSCLMTVNGQGEVTDYEIAESLIHVDARLSYNGVMRLYEEGDDSEIAGSLAWQGYRGIKGRTQKIAAMLRRMKKLAAVLKKKREERGSIDFDFPEAKIVLDEKGRPVEIVARERTEATDLIEDFMLLANETVARHCVYLEIPSVYRVHGVPAPDKMRELAQPMIRNQYGQYLLRVVDELANTGYANLD